MKNLLAITLIALCCISAQAQKTVKETYRLTTGKAIKLDLKFARTIKIEQWSKNEMSITATVDIDKGEGNDYYSLKSKASDENLEVRDDYGKYFEERRNQNNKVEISYVIYVPKTSAVTVKSISGNVDAENFDGRLKTDLVSGNVEIKNYQGELELKTVSGNLDIVINKANVDAKTVTGTIYSNIEIDTADKLNRGVGSHIKGKVNSGTDMLKLETVSGNIYMRKN